jgi:glycosyl transferase family 25
MPTLPIYVINLDRRPDRMVRIDRLLSGLGLDATRIAACDGRTAPAAMLDAVIADRGPLGPMGAGTRACTVSHVRVWRAFLASGASHALVLEDDVTLAPDVAGLMQGADWIPPGTEAVKLEKFNAGPSQVLLGPGIGATPAGRALHPLWSRHCGAGAYVISRRGAELALAHEGRIRVPVDHFLFNDTLSPIRADLAPSIVVPPMATQFTVDRDSDIDPLDRGARPRGRALQMRELRRGVAELSQAHRQLSRLASGRGRITSIRYTEDPAAP